MCGLGVGPDGDSELAPKRQSTDQLERESTSLILLTGKSTVGLEGRS